MKTLYRLRNPNAEAYQWDDQPREEWPGWLRGYTRMNPFGAPFVAHTRPGAEGGKNFMMLWRDDTKNEFQVYPGQWIVRVPDGRVTSYSASEFEWLFEKIL